MEYLTILNAQYADTISALGSGKFDDTLTDTLRKVAAEVSKNFS